MRLIMLLALSSALAFPATAQQATPVAPATELPASAKAELHDNTVKLVELTGARKRMEDNRDNVVQQGKEAMQRNSPDVNPAYLDEWAKRMRAQLNVDDFLNVIVQVYEKHFDNEEVLQLIQIQRDVNASKTPAVSPHLKEKLSAIGITMQSEILGGCSQVGAKLGGEIGQEISKEHPEWLKKAPAAAKP